MGRADLERLSKDELIELVLRLQRPEKTSRTSSKPPSMDRKERREQARPGGAKPGHEGHSRTLAQDPDRVIEHRPACCPDGRVANSDAGRRMGCARPQFHTLLTSGRPKQSASSRFCSRTVHAPAKPKPLRSHSIASKPWIVRRAVWKA
jgi:hypothetical protein